MVLLRRPRAVRSSIAFLYLALVLCAAGLTGCAQTVHDIGSAATSGAVPSAIAELQRTPNQQGLSAITASPPVEKASWTVGVGLGHGIVDGAIGEVMGEPVDPTSTTRPSLKIPAGTGDQISAFMKQNIEPAVMELVRKSAHEAMQEILGPDSQKQAGAMAQAIGDGTETGINRVFERDTVPLVLKMVREQIEPEVAKILNQQVRRGFLVWLKEDIDPYLKQLITETAAETLKMPTRPDIVPSVVSNARNLSIGGSLGAHDAAVELGFLDKNGTFTNGTKWFIAGTVTVLVLVGLVAIGFLIVLTMIARNLKKNTPAKTGVL